MTNARVDISECSVEQIYNFLLESDFEVSFTVIDPNFPINSHRHIIASADRSAMTKRLAYFNHGTRYPERTKKISLKTAIKNHIELVCSTEDEVLIRISLS